MDLEETKSKILDIYPNCFVYIHYDPEGDITDYCLMKEPYGDDPNISWRTYFCASGWHSSEAAVWGDVWQRILEQTLQKFGE